VTPASFLPRYLETLDATPDQVLPLLAPLPFDPVGD